MCQISFSIDATDSDGSTVSGEGRYKLSSTSTWSAPFSIPNISSASTPDINADGDYDLEVRVIDNNSGYSSWTSAAGFSIGNCSTTVFNNTIQLQSFTKNDCPTNQTGSTEAYVVLENTYQSNISQVDADQQATNDVQANGQNFANSNGTCTANSSLVINSSVPTANGEGTLDFTGGEPNEVLDLDFGLLFYNGSGNTAAKSIEFDLPVNVLILDSTHLSRTGTVTLDASGNASSNYTISEGELQCNVVLTGRSSSVGIPINSSTIIDMPNLVAV